MFEFCEGQSLLAFRRTLALSLAAIGPETIGLKSKRLSNIDRFEADDAKKGCRTKMIIKLFFIIF